MNQGQIKYMLASVSDLSIVYPILRNLFFLVFTQASLLLRDERLDDLANDLHAVVKGRRRCKIPLNSR